MIETSWNVAVKEEQLLYAIGASKDKDAIPRQMLVGTYFGNVTSAVHTNDHMQWRFYQGRKGDVLIATVVKMLLIGPTGISNAS